MYVDHNTTLPPTGGVDSYALRPLTARQRVVFGNETGYLLLMPGETARACRAVFNLDTMCLHVHVAARRFTVTGTNELGARIWPEQVSSLMHTTHAQPTNPACQQPTPKPCRWYLAPSSRRYLAHGCTIRTLLLL